MLKKPKKLQTTILVVLILLTTLVSCAATQPDSEIQTMPSRDTSGSSLSAQYTDIKDSWAYEAISYVLQEGLMEGTSDTTFSPKDTMTQADFTTALNKLAGSDIKEGTAGSDDSGDLTRQEMAVMLYEHAKSAGFSTEDAAATSFSDSGKIGSETAEAINSVISLGLMSGKTDGSFGPDDGTTRAEAATVIYRLCKLIDEANTSEEFLSSIQEKTAGILQYTDYKDDNYETISLKGSSVSCSGSGAEADGTTVTITKPGTYVISGTLKNGQIIVDSEEDENVRLVLNNASITSSDSSPILVRNAKNTILSLAPGTSNVLTDGSKNDDEDATGTLFSKDDLWINGNGSLTVNANFKDGISGNDDLEITEATIIINAADDGIVANDSVSASNADITVTAAGDGIKTTNGAEIENGYISVQNGSIDIDAGADAIQAETLLSIQDGVFRIETSQNNSDSSKGLKGGSGIIIEDGSFDIDSTDDAVHSNGIIRIENGTLDINAGDDGLHADTALTIDGGTIAIVNSYEGIESAVIEINGGTIDVTASDDGINVAGGNDSSSMGGRPGQNSFTYSGSNQLTINGGNIKVKATGDGIDVNGPAYMTGGYVQINGPTSNGNGALDYDGVFEISGGTLLAAGSSGMAQAPSSGSTQYIIANTTGEQAAGTAIRLADSSGNTIVTFTPVKVYSHIVISSPDISKDGVYTLYAGSTEIETFTISSIVTGDTAGGGMPGGGFRGGEGAPGEGGGMPGGGGTPPDRKGTPTDPASI